MSERINLDELQGAVARAVANVKFKPGPIILGFVAPDGISQAEAHAAAQEVARLTGIAGTPTVANIGSASAPAGERALKAEVLAPHHIIIGLVASERISGAS